MNGYIPKQPKQIKERIEAKLDVRLIRKLESYCEYLDSDRDYIIGQALEIAFKKDKRFGEWLSRQPVMSLAEAPGSGSAVARKRGRKPNSRPEVHTANSSPASTAEVPTLASPGLSKGA
jgi:hypothetical protein